MISSSYGSIPCDTIGCLKTADFVRVCAEEGGEDDFLCASCFESRSASFPAVMRDYRPLHALQAGEMERANTLLKEKREMSSETWKVFRFLHSPRGHSLAYCNRLLRKLELGLYSEGESVRPLTT